MKRKRLLWLMPLAAFGLLFYGIKLANPEAAGIVLIIVGGVGTFVTIGIAAEEAS